VKLLPAPNFKPSLEHQALNGYDVLTAAKIRAQVGV
jgi:hypothetical protein